MMNDKPWDDDDVVDTTDILSYIEELCSATLLLLRTDFPSLFFFLLKNPTASSVPFLIKLLELRIC